MKKENLSEIKKILLELAEETGIVAELATTSGKNCHSVDYSGESVLLRFSGDNAERDAKVVQYLLSNTDRHALPEREEYLRNILLGEGNGWYIYRFMTKYNLSEEPCYAIHVVDEKRMDETFLHLASCISDSRDLIVRMDEDSCAIVSFSTDQTPVEFAKFLAQSLYEEVGVRASVGIGGEVKSFAEISESYSQAVTAVRMSNLFASQGEVHSYGEYILVRMLEDVPESRLRSYMDEFRMTTAKEVFEDADMLETAERFLENSLNISETSRDLYMHRNTLMYRLDKIERVTGLNIRNFSDAVSFRVISILYKLMQR